MIRVTCCRVDNYSVYIPSTIRIQLVTCWIKDLLEVTGLSKKREGFIRCSDKGDMLSGWQLFCLYSQHYQNSVSYMLNQRSPWDYWVFKYMGWILWCSDEGDVCCQVDNYSVFDFFFSSIRILVITCWIKDLLEIISLLNKRGAYIWCNDEGDMLSGLTTILYMILSATSEFR